MNLVNIETKRINSSTVNQIGKYNVGYQKYPDGRLILDIAIWTNKEGVTVNFPIPFVNTTSITAAFLDKVTSITSMPGTFGFVNLTTQSVTINANLDGQAGYIKIWGYWK